MKTWLRRWWPHPPAAPPIAADSWQTAVSALPILDRLTPGDLEQLHCLASAFLSEKLFEPAGGMVISETVRIRIAALAALPVLRLGLGWFRDWRTLIVYPGQFVRPRSELDGSGVMHEWQDILGGESWQRGPVVLSWTDVMASGRGEGYNVVIHEMAHKLDMRNGAPDGFPPLPQALPTRRWTEAFSAAYADFGWRVERGEATAIDPYAAESPGEFFAVFSEYFFEQPDLVAETYPEVYELLALFFKQDPLRAGGEPSPAR